MALDFYVNTVRELIASGRLDPSASTLVVAGGPKDRAALLEAGFSDVTISNLDTRMRGDEFAPFQWASVDAEEIAFEDDSFDQVIDHMGLHHCSSPHRGLIEMYRVARKCILAFENRDSWTLRLAVRIGLVPTYELDAVQGNDYRFGGVRNTAIPNHVYRWTEREVMKTIASADAAHEVDVRFFYNLRYPIERIASFTRAKHLLLQALRLPFSVYAAIFSKQANEFAFFVNKASRRTQPWIDPISGGLTKSYNA